MLGIYPSTVGRWAKSDAANVRRNGQIRGGVPKVAEIALEALLELVEINNNRTKQ